MTALKGSAPAAAAPAAGALGAVPPKNQPPGTPAAAPVVNAPSVAPKNGAPGTPPLLVTSPPAVAPKNGAPGMTPPATKPPASALFSNKPASNAPAAAGATPAKPSAPEVPYGIPIPNRPGFVNSPFAAKHQLVDVTGLPVGMEVKCPYTGKLFRVPAMDIAEQKAAAAPGAPPAAEKAVKK